MNRQIDRAPDRRPRVRTLAASVIAAMVLLSGSAHAASPVPLGTADSFALLAGSTITNTGPTTITGDIGLCCSGMATPGFASVTQPDGALYKGPGTRAASAQDDLDIAYANAAAQPVTSTVPTDLSLTGTPANPLKPGVYESTAHGALQINTGLTLDFEGNPNAVFIFQGTTLTTAVDSGGSIQIVNGGSAPSACNIYWQLSDATQGVTLGTGSAFKGTTLALGASVLGTGATVEGRILTRRSKAVTLDTNTITRTACASGSGGEGTTGPTPEGSGETPADGAPGEPLPDSAAPTRSGTARIIGPGPGRLVRGPFTITVRGRWIKHVTFYIDGRRVRTVRATPGSNRFKLRIDPRGQDRSMHRVRARVRFTQRSRRDMTTRRTVYRRASLTPPTPRFTG